MGVEGNGGPVSQFRTGEIALLFSRGPQIAPEKGLIRRLLQGLFKDISRFREAILRRQDVPELVGPIHASIAGGQTGAQQIDGSLMLAKMVQRDPQEILTFLEGWRVGRYVAIQVDSRDQVAFGMAPKGLFESPERDGVRRLKPHPRGIILRHDKARPSSAAVSNASSRALHIRGVRLGAYNGTDVQEYRPLTPPAKVMPISLLLFI